MKNLNYLIVGIMVFGCSTETRKPDDSPSPGRYLTIKNKSIYLEEYGKGVPLLLLQGGGITRSTKDFEKCIPELAGHFRVIAPDTPGQGKSDQADHLSYASITEFMSVLMDSLHLDSAYVMGWSDGGIVGLLLAEKRPDKIKKVIAVGANNGLGGAVPPGVDIKQFNPQPIDEWEKKNKTVIEHYLQVKPRDWKKLVTELNTMWYAEEYFPKSVYDRIHIPVMIAQGDQDDIRLEHALAIHRSIRNSQFCVLPNCPHEVFEKKPSLINSIALGFFEK